MKDSELQTIERLTGVLPVQIKLADDGFWSRGYVSPDDSYLGIYGVIGRSLDTLSNLDYQSIGWLSDYFSNEEIARLDKFVFDTIPIKLKELGENIVYSHGDLGDGNIFVDDEDKVGIIDFSEMCYFDEVGDFMDVSSEELRTVMLGVYGTDETLREKVRLRGLVRSLIVFGDYARRG